MQSKTTIKFVYSDDYLNYFYVIKDHKRIKDKKCFSEKTNMEYNTVLVLYGRDQHQ